MPPYGQDRLSDGELAQIAAYVESLTPVQARVESLEMEDVVVTHHWMALMALQVDDAPEARHHARHIVELVEDPEHKQGMEEALKVLEAGNLHDTEHGIEEMLAGQAEPDLTLPQLHLRLAFAAVRGDVVGETRHHTSHFVELASGVDRVKAQQVLDLLAAGDMHEAGHMIEELLGRNRSTLTSGWSLARA